MIAVGLWGAQLGAPAVWMLPVAFPMMMAFGGFMGLIGLPLPGVEIGIALSAILLGAAVAKESRPSIAESQREFPKRDQSLLRRRPVQPPGLHVFVSATEPLTGGRSRWPMPSQGPVFKRFAKRTFTLPLLARSVGAVLLRLPVLAVATVRPAVPRALREKVMLGVNSVNGCRYCNWAHGRMPGRPSAAHPALSRRPGRAPTAAR